MSLEYLINNSQSPKDLDSFIVCGLGSLGQNCVVALKEFGIKIIGIEQSPPPYWEISNLPQLLEQIIIGDCREIAILQQANIEKCRGILIVTSNEEVNFQTALIAREINPNIHLVLRSAQENLNQLLSQQLGNIFIAEPTQLTVAAFVIAGLRGNILGFFTLDRQKLQVVKHLVKSEDAGFHNRFIQDLNTRNRRILSYKSISNSGNSQFHQWRPDTTVQIGDTLIYIEIVDKFSVTKDQSQLYNFQSKNREKNLFYQVIKVFNAQRKKLNRSSLLTQTKNIINLSFFFVIFLLLIGTFLFHYYYNDVPWLYAFYGTIILLLGGFGDLFGQFQPVVEIPWWLQLFALILTLTGTAFVGILYASITENLLSIKFDLNQNRPPIPEGEHFVIIGLERVGQKVIDLFKELNKEVVAITFSNEFDRSLLPNIPLINGNLKESLLMANLPTARSVMVTTENELMNLEIALTSRTICPNSHLVIGTVGKGLTDHLTRLLEKTQVISVYGVAAEAFAGAAFGENILSLFRQNDQTILVTEYEIEEKDTLNGLLISQVAYGYGVVVILHQSPPETSRLMPSDDLQLRVGDRIVVLATGEGLQRIEKGEPKEELHCWQVRLEEILSEDAKFEGANTISRITGCKLSAARNFLNNVPQTMPIILYEHQAYRLIKALKKLLIKSSLVPVADSPIVSS
ncbi:MAG: potassium channel family protein [Snowella sp.]